MRNLLIAMMIASGSVFTATAVSADSFTDGKNYISLRNQVVTQSPEQIGVI